MNKAEYWLLDSVVTDMYPLVLLASPDIEMHFNRSGHGLRGTHLVQALLQLFEDGDLIAERLLGEGEADGPAFIPSSKEIEEELFKEDNLFRSTTV